MWALTLAEYNAYIDGYGTRAKSESAQAILTGYYTAYYMNGGKKAKSPDKLIRSLYGEKQSYESGMQEIERIKKLEKGG